MAAKRLSKAFSHLVPQSSSKGPSATQAHDTTTTSEGTKAESAKTAASGVRDSEEVKEEKKLPTFDELPMFKNMPGCAWTLWGENDQLGTVNLLTEEVVARAAKEEIKYDTGVNSVFLNRVEFLLCRTGKSVSLNW